MNINGDLDDVDRAIIAALRQDPRLANRTLARTVGISVPTLYSRLRELHDAGVFEIRAQLDIGALGYTRMGFVDVYVQGRSAQDVARDLVHIDEVMSVLEFVEEPKIVLPMIARDDAHMVELAMKTVGCVAGVSRVMINNAMRIEQYGWGFGEIGVDRHEPIPVVAAATALDAVDLALVERLRTDARMNNRQVGEAIGISETNTRKRLARLQEDGQLRFSLVVAPMKIGLNIWAYVRFAVRPDRIENIIEALGNEPLSQSLIGTSGQWNLHWFGLFAEEASLNQLALRLAEIAGHDIDMQVRRVHRVEKHNCDYVRIV